MIHLPVDDFLPEVVDSLQSRSALVVIADPGAGKSTRVPPALLSFGKAILLQPRRVAARAIARRIAEERGWSVGREIGWQIRFENNAGPETRLLVATEGILTARLQSDPLLSEFNVVVLDEFHERSIHSDLAIALVREALLARSDLKVVVMSATLDPGPVQHFLDAAVLKVPGRMFPVAVEHRAGKGVAEVVRQLLPSADGHILGFLPGLREIDREAAQLRDVPDIALHRLHSSIDGEQQDLALRPSSRPKVILATNIAETSLTIDGVTAVVDSGLQKVLRYDPSRAMDRLEVERISRDSANQRAGRAGRTAKGRAVRLWDERDFLEDQREPEIHRIDLAAPLLEVIAWGGDPFAFRWFERPESDRLKAAMELLRLLGAIDAAGRITALGEVLHRLPLHPRIGRMLLAAGATKQVALACALLNEGVSARAGEHRSTDSDLLDLVDLSGRAFERHAAELQRIVRQSGQSLLGDEDLRRAAYRAFPDRLARRRAAGSDALVTFSGQGAVQARESGVRSEFLVALDVGSIIRDGVPVALVRMASAVDKEWVSPTSVDVVHRYDAASRAVRALEQRWCGRILLQERNVPPDPEVAGRLLSEELRREGPDEELQSFLLRAQFAGVEVDLPSLFDRVTAGRTSMDQLRLRDALPAALVQQVQRNAPEFLPLPSGRRVRLQYREDGGVEAAVKLQELFGLADTPLLGPRRVPVTFLLLAPSGRPVQTTRDLRSFWERTYPDVRKELRGRYPKHPWPDDPWSATPTAKTKRR